MNVICGVEADDSREDEQENKQYEEDEGKEGDENKKESVGRGEPQWIRTARRIGWPNSVEPMNETAKSHWLDGKADEPFN